MTLLPGKRYNHSGRRFENLKVLANYKILQARFQQMCIKNFHIYLEKAEEPEVKLPTSLGS